AAPAVRRRGPSVERPPAPSGCRDTWPSTEPPGPNRQPPARLAVLPAPRAPIAPDALASRGDCRADTSPLRRPRRWSPEWGRGTGAAPTPRLCANHDRRNAIPQAGFASATVQTLGNRQADEVGHGHALSRGSGLEAPVKGRVDTHGKRLPSSRGAPDGDG